MLLYHFYISYPTFRTVSNYINRCPSANRNFHNTPGWWLWMALSLL